MPGLVVSPAFWPGIGCLFAGEGGCLPVRTDEPGLFDPVGDLHLYVFDLGYPCPEVREYRAEQIDLGNGALIGTFRFHVPLPASCGPMVFKESLKKSPEHATFRGFVLCVGVGLFREAFADAKEILGLEGCAADQDDQTDNECQHRNTLSFVQ